MTRTQRLAAVMMVVATAALPAAAQDTRPAEAQDTTAVAAVVQGKVFQAPIGTPATEAGAWTPVAQGDRIGPGQQIRTSLRSTVLLQFGNDTAIQVRPMSLASISELFETASQRSTKLGLAYGAIRGSVVEKGLRTDLVIETPTATLSKEGTENWEMMQVAHSNAWFAQGPTQGMIAVRDGLTGRVERVSFPQLLNFFNMADLSTQRTIAQRVVQMYENQYLSSGEADFETFFKTGNSVIGPGLGSQAYDYAPNGNPGQFGGVGGLSDEAVQNLLLAPPSALIFRQLESRFGTGPRPGGNGELMRSVGRSR